MEKEITVYAKLAGEMQSAGQNARSMLARIDELESAIASIDLALLETENAERTMLSTITKRDVEQVLDGFAANIDQFDRERLKDLLAELTEQIQLSPKDLSCRIHYKIPAARGNKLASPRGFEPRYSP